MKKLSLVFAMILMSVSFLLAQRNITGKVTDTETGEGLISASVIVEGTSTGTVTDASGNYSINMPEGSTVLVFSYTGYTTQKVTVGAENVLNIQLTEGISVSQVIVTALGVAKDDKAIGYAVQSVDGEEIQKAATPSVVDALRGQAAGVNVIRSSGTVGGGTRIVIRGQTSLIGENQPLFIVDGVRIDNSTFNSEAATAGTAVGNRAMDINPADIESINVLKGAAATALYGLDGAQGVVIITTKKGKAGKGLNINFSTSYGFENITQMPLLQSTYAQGSGGVYGLPERGSSTSWGPKISDLEFATDQATYTSIYSPSAAQLAKAFTDGVYNYDPNGFLVPAGQGNGRAANAYDPIGGFFQTGTSATNSLSVDGGNDLATFRASFSTLKSEGIIPNNTYDRNTFSLGTSLKITDKLSINANANYARSDYGRIQQGSNTSGLLLGLLRTPPSFDNAGGFEDPANSKGSYEFANGTQRNYRGGGGYDNPFWTVNNTLRFEKVDRAYGNVAINYAASPWFNVSLKTGMDSYTDTRKQEFEINSRTVSAGRVIHDDYFVKISDNYLNINGGGQLTEDLSLSYLVGANAYSFFSENNYKQGDGLALQDFVHISNTSSITANQTITGRRTAGIYASADFGYKNFLYLGLTARNDWVSTLIDPAKEFNGGDISFLYPSASLGFVFSEFLANQDVLSFGKLRVSYAQVGGGAPLSYVTSTPYINPSPGDGWGEAINFPFNGKAGFVQSNRLGNPNLVPEQTNTIELGADLRFFNGKLNLDVTYYDRTSSNLIINASLPASTGFTSAFLNSGEIESNGLEVILTATPVQTSKFSWTTTINFDRNRTTVTKLAQGLEQLQIGGFTGTGTYLVAGQPYAQLFGGAYLRTGAGGDNDDGLTIPEGDIIIRDDGSGEHGYQIPDSKLRVLGNPNPDFNVGWNNTLSFGPVNVAFLFDWRQGGQMWNGTAWALSFFGMSQLSADTREETPFVIEGVKESDGTPNDIAIVRDENYWTSSVGGFGLVDEQFVQETTWYRLRLLSLGADLDPSWFGLDGKVQAANLSITGRNLWFQTPYEGVDPETSLEGTGNAQGFDYFNMPSTRSFTIGLNVRF
jgi:TonB-linked SusC/RagA family outer membrane protein